MPFSGSQLLYPIRKVKELYDLLKDSSKSMDLKVRGGLSWVFRVLFNCFLRYMDLFLFLCLSTRFKYLTKYKCILFVFDTYTLGFVSFLYLNSNKQIMNCKKRPSRYIGTYLICVKKTKIKAKKQDLSEQNLLQLYTISICLSQRNQ